MKLPERRKSPAMDASYSSNSTYFRGLGWNECLDEVVRLNANDPIRAALMELLAAHTEAAGFKASMVYDRQQFTDFLDRSQKRVDDAVAQARAALAEDSDLCKSSPSPAEKPAEGEQKEVGRGD